MTCTILSLTSLNFSLTELIMKIKTTLVLLYLNILLISSSLRETKASSEAITSHGVYIVYMGGASGSQNGMPRNDHSELLSMLSERENTVLHSYTNGFSGFAARLSEEEAKSIAKRAGVVSVFPDPVLQLHTTHSWDFLEYQSGVNIDSRRVSRSHSLSTASTRDTIIGILDTGIWPESESFNDDDLGPIPSRWKGTCMKGVNFNSSNCNRKLIGARYYNNGGSPRDDVGHGTHVASTAAGNAVSGASYYGLAKGDARGGSPSSRIAVYRVCTAGGGCMGSSILKGLDDAIGDGVDVISMSLGSSPGDPDIINDPISIGAFHAVEKGIPVVCSAGNSGPAPGSVVNVAPWILTVAGTSIDRDFETDIVLAGNKVIKGGGINLSNLDESPVYPLIDGDSAKVTPRDDYSGDGARNCIPGLLDDNKVKGKIVLCDNRDSAYESSEKFDALKNQGAIGMILTDSELRQAPSRYKTNPVVSVTEQDGAAILSYIKTNRNPLATILPTRTIPSYRPAPVVGYFSSRGPTIGIKNLLKPDVAAPGVAILASWPSNDAKEALLGRRPPMFNILSGTSMSCPHVSGLVATVKAQHPKWSPSAISSAIMTTAIQKNNLQAPITTEDGSIATPFDIGAGQIVLSGPLDPGLVYETDITDYAHFICNMGYDTSDVKNIASTLPSDFSCPHGSSSDLISNMNYPSIAISELENAGTKTVTRTVTNVGGDESTYTVSIVAPDEVEVKVNPHTLHFTKNVCKLKFTVSFRQVLSFDTDVFGSITWSNGEHNVRSPFVVSNSLG